MWTSTKLIPDLASTVAGPVSVPTAAAINIKSKHTVCLNLRQRFVIACLACSNIAIDLNIPTNFLDEPHPFDWKIAGILITMNIAVAEAIIEGPEGTSKCMDASIPATVAIIPKIPATAIIERGDLTI